MKPFVLRGQTASGLTHTINFSGHKGDYGFKLIDFKIYPSTDIGAVAFELSASITAGKTAVDPTAPNFKDEGLIATAFQGAGASINSGPNSPTVINDTFMITQDLILKVMDSGSGGSPVNWQCHFEPVKLSTSEAALTNYRQFMVFDE